MTATYDPAAWQIFYAAIAGAAAGLTGLLFVALSLHQQAIVAHPASRGRARETLGGFISLLVIAILVLIPGQGRRLLGIELLVVGVVIALASARFQGQTLRALRPYERRRRLLHLAPINAGTAALLIAGGSLVLGVGGGLYWSAATILCYLLNALDNAWTLTVRPDAE